MDNYEWKALIYYLPPDNLSIANANLSLPRFLKSVSFAMTNLFKSLTISLRFSLMILLIQASDVAPQRTSLSAKSDTVFIAPTNLKENLLSYSINKIQLNVTFGEFAKMNKSKLTSLLLRYSINYYQQTKNLILLEISTEASW